MSLRPFLLSLVVVSALAAVLVFWLNTLPRLQGHEVVGWASLAIFILISLGAYFGGQRAARSANKHHFTNLVLGVTFSKLMLAIVFVLGYNQLVQPGSRFFIIPFFVVYLIYTIYETYLMMKLGQTSSSND